MTPERWQRIKSLLEAALDCAPGERDAFLKQACGDDSSLRSQIQSLILSHEQAGDFIESPAFELMADSLDQSQSMVGSNLGPYRISGRLGAGGMGEVYLAEDTRLGRRVALKVLLAHFTMDEERVRRFQMEARAASALNHPNILTIYEIGQVSSRHFMVTELIEGETLRRHLSKGPITISEALDIAIQIASALSAAHAAAIVHRDIKPDNVMVRADGIVKVLDFGLAKLTEAKSGGSEALSLVNTEQGMVMGTAHYMSPEQARGLPVDLRTDIWSLGVVLYEMIGKRVPFDGGTGSDVIAAILGQEPITLARQAPEVPTELEWIVMKALRKDREERYQTAKELLTDLRSLKQKLEFEEQLQRSRASGENIDDLIRKSGSPSSRLERQSHERPPQRKLDSLAILPLINKCTDPGLEYLSDGITESIISSLSQLAGLRVMAWSTVSRYKGRDVEPRQVGRDLGVNAVLTGRVLQTGERLVIKTELVNAIDGSHLWGENYSCEPSDILGIEAEISRAISEKLLVRLTTAERTQLTRRYPDNVEAYHAYLRGRYFWNKRSEEGLKKGIEHFQQAIDEDPGYAAAYAGMSDCYTILVVRYGLPSEEGIPKAKAAAMKAIEIDDTLAEAHTSLAHSLLHNWEWDKSEREFKRAVELNPNDANAHNFYAEYLRAMGRVEQALKVARRAQELDPLSLNHITNVANELYFARRYDQAIDQCRKTLEMDRNFFLAHYRAGQAYERKGMFEEAIAAIQRAVELSPDNIEMLAALGRVLAVSGRRDKAQLIVDQLEARIEHRHSWHFDIALIYAGLGEVDRAFACLEKGFAWREGMMIHLNGEPGFDSLRSDPRFQDLVRRMGLPPIASFPPATLLWDQQRTETKKQPAGVPTVITPTQSWWGGAVKMYLALGIMVVLAGMGYLLLRSIRATKETPSLKNASFTQLTDQAGAEFFPSLSPDGQSVVYASRAAGNWDIYLQLVGTRDAVNLTKDSPADDTQPAFSPDGQRIAFRSEREGGGIYSMNSSGDSVVRLSNFGYSPAWYPDAERILVGTEKIPQPSTRPTRSQLWTINIKTNERRLISEGDALQPTCSPHRQRIAYWSRPSKYGQRESVWTIPADGGEPVPVTQGTSTDLNPTWSPDGGYLYFSSDRGGSNNIWRVAIDEESGALRGEPEAVTAIGATNSALQLSLSGDGRRLAYIAQQEVRNLRKVSFDPATGKTSHEPISITRGSMQLWFPDVSPDGEWLTSYSMGARRHVFIMRTDGSELRDLTDDSYRYAWPRWSPDGNRIAFSSRRPGNYELWVINRDGSGLQQLTQAQGAHYAPWSPDGKQIAYSIHVPKNDCVLFEPGKAWNEQKLEYLPPLGDGTLSFEGWSWSPDGKKLAGIKHLPSGVHSGIGVYDLESKTYDWLTDFGDWPLWLNDHRLLFVSSGQILLFNTRTRKYQPVLTVTDQDVDIGSPSLSPDNRTIYFTYVAAEADIWLMSLD